MKFHIIGWQSKDSESKTADEPEQPSPTQTAEIEGAQRSGSPLSRDGRTTPRMKVRS